MSNSMREIVIPGDLVDDSGRLRPGQNTYREGDRIYATRLGVRTVRGDRVNVVQLAGRYEPQRGDMVIGTVVEVGPSNWYIKVGAAHDCGMHVNDVPWRVDFGETSKYLAVGDTVLLKIYHVDDMRKVQVSMKDRQCRKLTGGIIVEVSPAKVPRVIGRNGSMISMIKDLTNTRMFIGQNGIVWIDGDATDVEHAVNAIKRVEAEAHTSGLTDKIRESLEKARGVSYEDVRGKGDSERAYGGREEEEEEGGRERRPREGAEGEGGAPAGDAEGDDGEDKEGSVAPAKRRDSDASQEE